MNTRAYSILNIKAVDEEQRVIRGVATSPSPDRMRDIVEPFGVKFKNPMPLLHQHDSERPVGTVKFDKPTKDGITFEAKLPKIAEPGPLKDRVDTAWGEVKAGLVRAVSIGFRPLEFSIMDDGGYRYTETEVLELSLVTVPANADATITSIKSIVTQERAALGHTQKSVVRLSTSAGVSAASRIKQMLNDSARKEGTEMNTSEQIRAFEAKRQASAARMEEIMAKAADENRTLDEAESEEYDTLGVEVKSVDGHLVRLKSFEASQAAKAKPVEGGKVTTIEGGTVARGTSVIAVEKKLEKGIAFARFVGCMARAKGNATEALAFAKQTFPEYSPLHEVIKMHTGLDRMQIVERAAVSAGTTTDTTWAGPLVQYNDMAQDFIEFLRPQTIVGRIANLRRVPFNIRVPRQTAGGSAAWVGEGAPKPVTAFAFDNVTLRFTKLAAISVITQELARFSSPSAETIIRDQLAKAIVQQMDSDFINPANSGTADVKPASITYGVTPVSASGTSEAAIRLDLRNVFAQFIAANLTPANGVWIMSATTALALSLMVNSLGQPVFPGIGMTGGTFQGLPVVVSEAAGLLSTGSPSSPIVILANASDILLADDGQVSIDVSQEASLQMNSTPDNPATASTVYRSLWQDNLIGIRAERFVNWVKARSEAVQFIDNVAWGTA